jgi:hypothetical protein
MTATGPAYLRGRIGVVDSRMGACFVGSHAVFRGRDLHADLGDASWIDVFLLGITGRRHSPAELRLLEAFWTYTSYPDARIWNNRAAALAGSARSTGNLGVSAALALSEASIYGRGIDIRAIDFFLRARAALAAGGELAPFVRAELEARRSIAGYGRPIAAGDERIGPILALARSLDLAGGPHLALAHDVEDCLQAGRYRLRMNYGAVVAALAADLGLSPREYYHFMYPAFLAGMIPCHIEAASRPEGAFLPLPCEGIDYRGTPKRPWRTP